MCEKVFNIFSHQGHPNQDHNENAQCGMLTSTMRSLRLAKMAFTKKIIGKSIVEVVEKRESCSLLVGT